MSWPSWLTYSDGLPTLVVTHQLQVERRTGKVRQPETDVLPLCHATNSTRVVPDKRPLNGCVCAWLTQVVLEKRPLNGLIVAVVSPDLLCNVWWSQFHHFSTEFRLDTV